VEAEAAGYVAARAAEAAFGNQAAFWETIDPCGLIERLVAVSDAHATAGD
jgi:S-formylglutathione hydrolase FrmB